MGDSRHIRISMIVCSRYSFLPNLQIVAPTEIYVPGMISIFVSRTDRDKIRVF